MPDINNSVALGIKNDPIDIAGTLAKAAAIRDMNAHADIQQQSYAEREREYGENGGLTSGQRATMNDTQQKAIGAVGNIWVNDQSGGARKQGLDMLDRAGVPLDTMTRAHLATAPAPQLQQYGQNAQRLGQSSTTNIEQSGVPSGNATREAGRFIPEGIQPNTPYTSRTDAATGGPKVTPASPAQTAANLRAGVNNDGTPSVNIANSRSTVLPNQQQSVFQPRIVRNPDGTISSSVTPETQGLQGAAVDRFKQMQDTAAKAQGLNAQLDAIEHDNEVLNTGGGWSSTGSGSNIKMQAAKNVNSFFQTFGMAAPIDPGKVGTWEAYNKQTIQAAGSLAKNLAGAGGEAVLNTAVNATPNTSNTFFGSKVITNSLRQVVQRESDIANFATQRARETGSTFGAEAEFNKRFPPKLYSQAAVANAIPENSIKRLTDSGGAAKDKSQFDSVYGKGMADFVLKQGAR